MPRKTRRHHPLTRLLALAPLALLLGGCNLVIMNPAGDVAAQQRDLIVYSTLLMLIIIIPVILLTLLFAWRYRASNKAAKYDPEWHHSTQLEVIIWAAPLVIIVALGALTWVGTHLLDPYRPLQRLDAERLIPEEVRPLEVEVVALDWKWLFIYPQQGIATVNELRAPVDVPINFRITASSVMNALSIPSLAGMIYAMPGMETKLHAVMNQEGVYDGMSANYSGAGFSDMRFKFHGMSQQGFDAWVAEAKAGGGGTLGRAEYLELERPSVRDAVKRFSAIDPALFKAVVERCVDPAKMCMSDMMAIDARGGMGAAGTVNVASLDYDKTARRGSGPSPAAPARRFVLALCTPADPLGTGLVASAATPDAGKATN
ncbi:ubiquinol oxidase subunit II [Roseomonas haemaphysalidis]|uniref:Ubiquinol oxidase subunit 2 n=1 Tax=Roseomonas haemaphysalidis TaxID=2768162 RepID=A0ABS3KPR3_9PROT|nr:ubiquinol oxidase subunit II [Roseomonas haemaphysalidis]MBO1079422.1 ubiquinol oxidase subunit II [Roseomonas haemaphysalidis]